LSNKLDAKEMKKISNYFKNNINLQNFNLNNSQYSEDIKNYYQNAQSDAIHCYCRIKRYLDKNKKILEVGGGDSFAYKFFKSRLRYYISRTGQIYRLY
jgi:hypothetical protein